MYMRDAGASSITSGSVMHSQVYVEAQEKNDGTPPGPPHIQSPCLPHSIAEGTVPYTGLYTVHELIVSGEISGRDQSSNIEFGPGTNWCIGGDDSRSRYEFCRGHHKFSDC